LCLKTWIDITLSSSWKRFSNDQLSLGIIPTLLSPSYKVQVHKETLLLSHYLISTQIFLRSLRGTACRVQSLTRPLKMLLYLYLFYFIVFCFAASEFEFSVLCLLGKYSTIWTMPLVLFFFSFSFFKGVVFLSVVCSDSDPPTYDLLCNWDHKCMPPYQVCWLRCSPTNFWTVLASNSNPPEICL
jgi:hypothetical protein